MTRHLASLIALYLTAYFACSSFDLGTTALALRQTGVHEQNVFVTHGSAYQSAVAWLITCVGALFTASCVVFAVRYAARVPDYWLRHPALSFAKLYINPWSKSALPFSPLHMLSFAIGFVLFRFLAGVNNLLIWKYGVAPIGAPIQWVANHSSAIVGFAVVIFPTFYVLAIAVSPISANVLRSLRPAPGIVKR